MAFKSVTNSGISDADLARGFCETGAIPEVGESISNADAAMAKEKKEAARHRADCEKYGWEYSEPRGGFMDDCDE